MDILKITIQKSTEIVATSKGVVYKRLGKIQSHFIHQNIPLIILKDLREQEKIVLEGQSKSSKYKLNK